MKKQVCILVMGMHRSGTSAMTGVLEKLGVYLGSDLIDKNWDNPKGFFENSHFVAFNKKFLKHLHTPLEVPNFKIELADDSLELLKNMISQQFKYDSCFAIKDPRISFLFPLYKKALEELNIEIKCLIPTRHPLEVAKSLQKRNGFSLEKSLLMWSEHFYLTEKITRGNCRLFINFDELIANPKLVCQKISQKLSLDFLQYSEEVDDFLEIDLKHYTTKVKDIPKTFPSYLVRSIDLLQKIDSKKSADELDVIYKDFLDYKDVFYNKELIGKLDLYEEVKEQLIQKDKELTQTKGMLQQKEQALHVKSEELNKTKTTLTQKDKELSKTKENLTQKEQALHVKSEELNKTKETLTQQDKIIAKQQKEIEELKDELVLFYEDSTCVLAKTIRKVKGILK